MNLCTFGTYLVQNGIFHFVSCNFRGCLVKIGVSSAKLLPLVLLVRPFTQPLLW